MKARTLTPLFMVLLAAAACAGENEAASPGEAAAPVDDTAATAGTDATASIVDLDDIILDTFDGGSVPLSEASDEQIAALRDAIPPLDQPAYQPAETAGWLDDDDLVIGYQAEDGSAWAYPHRILNFHEIVNDELAGVPVLISYCPLCASGVVFDRRLRDLRHEGVLSFGNTSALFENDLVMVDRETDSFWWQVPGRAIVGSLSGAELEVLASTTTTWRQWRTRHPATAVLSRDTGFQRDYERDPFTGYADLVDAGDTPFPVSPAVLADDRLSPGTRVIGIEAGTEAAVVPVGGSARTVPLVIADRSFEVVLDGHGGADVVILGEDGEQPWPSRATFWFAYLAAFPHAVVVE